MAYKHLEDFSKIVKTGKSLRQSEIRIDIDKALLILTDMAVLLSQKSEPTSKEKQPVFDEQAFDGGNF
jgi:hypothetical protein